jgi:hypothetical protein
MNMKRLLLISGILVIAATSAVAQTASPYRKVNNGAFKRGEELKFRLHYGAVNAGEAVVKVDESKKLIGGRPTMHIVANGYSKGAFDWVFRVRDYFESYVDEEALIPWIFMRRCDEGGFKINQNQTFNHISGQVNSSGKTMTVPKNVQDMVSSFFYARTLDYSAAKKGDVFEVKTFMDDEIWDLKIKFIGRETIKTDLGKIACMKFVPVVQKGRVFKKEDDLLIWISDDANKIPIRVQAEILVGSVKMDIISAKGLVVPLKTTK